MGTIEWESIETVDSMGRELKPGDVAIVARNTGWRHGLVLEPCVVIKAIKGRKSIGEKQPVSRYYTGQIQYARFEYKVVKGRYTDEPIRKNMTLHCQNRFVKIDRSTLNLTNPLHVKTLELAKEVETEYVRSPKK